MGGIGSGAKRSTQVGNVEDMLALDVRAMRRLGLLRTGECIIDAVHWSNDGLRVASAHLRSDLCDIQRGGTVTITAEMPDGKLTQRITVEAVPSAYGGHRCYFVCPMTGNRCEVMYYARGRFASRQAQRLTYAVQGMTDLSRARRKVAKLRSRVLGKGLFPRVRGAHRIDTIQELRLAEIKAHEMYQNRLRDYADRSGPQR